MGFLLSISTDDLILALLGYLIVFAVLVMLFLVFQNLPKILGSITYVRKEAKKMREQLFTEHKPDQSEEDEVLTGEVCAAIALALHTELYAAHDEEDMRLTIQKISRSYSPWSSKIYGVNNQPQRR